MNPSVLRKLKSRCIVSELVSLKSKSVKEQDNLRGDIGYQDLPHPTSLWIHVRSFWNLNSFREIVSNQRSVSSSTHLEALQRYSSAEFIWLLLSEALNPWYELWFLVSGTSCDKGMSIPLFFCRCLLLKDSDKWRAPGCSKQLLRLPFKSLSEQ